MPVHAWLTILKITTDGFMLWLGMNTAYFLRFSDLHQTFGLSSPASQLESYPLQTFFLSCILVFFLAIQGRYNITKKNSFLKEIGALFWSLTGAFGFLVLVFFFARIFFFSRFVFLAAWGLSFAFLVWGRILIQFLQQHLVHKGLGRTKTILYTENHIGSVIKEYIENNNTYEMVHLVQDLSQADEILKKYKPDIFILATENLKNIDIAELTRVAHRNHVKLSYVPDETALDLSHVEQETLANVPLLTLHYTNFEGWGVVLKTILDYAGAFIGIIVLSPVFCWIWLMVKKERSDASAFFVSERVGKGGKKFKCYKFRTMVPNAHAQRQHLLEKNERGDVLFKMENDPRVTSLGKFLRTTSLDELPQLFNVLEGKMSLVGPRAHLPEEVEQYHLDDLRVLSLKPGITGYAQINGRSQNSYAEEMRYELYYVQNWSFLLDIFILWKTLGIVARQENVS